jgi:hypothetical protein
MHHSKTRKRMKKLAATAAGASRIWARGPRASGRRRASLRRQQNGAASVALHGRRSGIGRVRLHSRWLGKMELMCCRRREDGDVAVGGEGRPAAAGERKAATRWGWPDGEPRAARGRRAHRLAVPPRPWERSSARGGRGPAAIAARKVEEPPPRQEVGDPPPRREGGGAAATEVGRPGQGRAERVASPPHRRRSGGRGGGNAGPINTAAPNAAARHSQRNARRRCTGSMAPVLGELCM